MKFNFKIQQYQTDAVDAVVKVFAGQGFHDRIRYIRDLGKRTVPDVEQTEMKGTAEVDPDDDTGYKTNTEREGRVPFPGGFAKRYKFS